MATNQETPALLTAEEAVTLGELYDQGLVLEKAGNTEQAAILYRQCLSIDPADHCGVSVRLAVLGLDHAPEKSPDAYVMTLFDQHAADFDEILTYKLGYAVPMQLAEILRSLPARRYERMLDLGCGTGLSGLTLSALCDHLTGVDLSEKMTDEADERAVYDTLFVNEATHFLEEWQKAVMQARSPVYQPFDLIVATDVLPYIGALESLMAGIASNLKENGKVALSCETMPDADFGDAQWRLTPHQRFAHRLDYLTACLSAQGLSKIDHVSEIIVRYEEGKPIPGWLIVVSREADHG